MLLTACHDIPGYDNTRRDNFECLWRLVDEHYCFFDSVSEDWQAIGDRYRPQADTARTTSWPACSTNSTTAMSTSPPASMSATTAAGGPTTPRTSACAPCSSTTSTWTGTPSAG